MKTSATLTLSEKFAGDASEALDLAFEFIGEQEQAFLAGDDDGKEHLALIQRVLPRLSSMLDSEYQAILRDKPKPTYRGIELLKGIPA